MVLVFSVLIFYLLDWFSNYHANFDAIIWCLIKSESLASKKHSLSPSWELVFPSIPSWMSETPQHMYGYEFWNFNHSSIFEKTRFRIRFEFLFLAVLWVLVITFYWTVIVLPFFNVLFVFYNYLILACLTLWVMFASCLLGF